MVRTEGEIIFDEKPIQQKSTESIASLGIGHVPDGRGTFLELTAEENLEVGAFIRRDRSGVTRDLERIYGYFPRLKERRRQAAGTLSGGEQQMLAIGRVLMTRPQLLLLDEPSFGLAPQLVHAIFDILRSIRETDKVSVLLVEQNAKMALAFADYAYLLETGSVVMEGPAAEVANDEAVRRSYLGY
jgi:branched-chain amino acid transport system ATP-binding protein